MYVFIAKKVFECGSFCCNSALCLLWSVLGCFFCLCLFRCFEPVSCCKFVCVCVSLSPSISLSLSLAQLRKAELERHYTESMLDTMRKRFEEEMLAVETSYKSRMSIIEDSNRKKETRLREENEALMQQHVQRVRQLEQEKGEVCLSVCLSDCLSVCLCVCLSVYLICR